MSEKKKSLTKKSKIVIGVSVVAAVIIIVSAIFIIFTGNSSYKLYNSVMLQLMPESITSEDGVEFFVKENPKYDGGKTPEEEQFIFYFKNGDKEVDLPGGVFTDAEGNKSVVSFGFVKMALEKLNTIKTVFKVVIAVMVVVLVAIGIYLWYKSWCRREDEQKKLLYGDSKANKKKN